ncbi:hypothetical protein NEOLEDRAFT_1142457 [Neolentinus lepideus HHB14362 ss-1]|uniref:Uncharacterized protein n=1 Tax=Neolentinus lepideus HHB14362 ss-1 TaxID=1314782 RepID=A0A165N4V0_9AGAM|nr:hypothetical protein NEOLEDRAFT_1142457 [Neolentinus lepideus HHB14362 ss-1]
MNSGSNPLFRGMSTVYTPLFPATARPEPYHPLSSSESSTSTSTTLPANRRPRGQPYNDYLSSRYLALACLPVELHPASRSPSPSSEFRVAAIRKDIQRAAEDAGWDTSSTKWPHVSRRCKLAGTTGRWRASDRKEKGRRCEIYSARKLPEREEDWLAWERKVLERREGERLRSKGKGKEKAADEKELVKDQRPRQQRKRVAEIVDRVTNWQANVQWESYEIGSKDARARQAAEEAPPQIPSSEAMEDGNIRPEGLVQSSLGFPVIKRSSQGQLAGKGSKGKFESQTLGTGLYPVYEEPVPERVPMRSGPSSQAEHRERDVLDTDPPVEDSTNQPQKRISDVPESSFFPPSFPTHIQTSTPTGLKQKPLLIPTSAVVYSSLDKFPPRSVSPRRTHINHQPVGTSSSSPLTNKRARPLTPISDDVRMRSSSQTMPPTSLTPVLKKARTMGEIPVVRVEPPSMSSGNLSRKTGGAFDRVGSSPAIPSTPHRNEKLPTLNELLSSRGSGKNGKTKHTKLKIAPSSGGKETQSQLQSRANPYKPLQSLTEVPEVSQEGVQDFGPRPMKADVQPMALTRTSSLASPALGPSTPDPRDGPLIVLAPESPTMRFTQHPSAFLP